MIRHCREEIRGVAEITPRMGKNIQGKKPPRAKTVREASRRANCKFLPCDSKPWHSPNKYLKVWTGEDGLLDLVL